MENDETMNPKIKKPELEEDEEWALEITNPKRYEVDDALHSLGGYSEYQRELRGDNLTFGDY